MIYQDLAKNRKDAWMKKKERNKHHEAEGLVTAATPSRAHPVEGEKLVIGGMRGFRTGWRWGSTALGLALRRPLHFGFGWLCFIMAAVILVKAPVMSWIVFFALCSGMLCAGEVARIGSQSSKHSKAPFSSWFAPWAKGRRLSSLSRVAASMAMLVVISFGAKFAQQAVFEGYDATNPSSAVSSGATALSATGVYGLWLWLIFSTAPVRPWGELAATMWRAFKAPMAALGFGVFVFLWLALNDVLLTWILKSALESSTGAAAVSPNVVAGLGAIAAMSTVALNAPLLAMAAGLASLDLAPPPAPALPVTSPDAVVAEKSLVKPSPLEAAHGDA